MRQTLDAKQQRIGDFESLEIIVRVSDESGRPLGLKADAERHGHRDGDADRTRFMCHDCCDAPTCELVYDLYNTDGDCLASK